jgi:septal ring factor EnvC (AmiA/AmiB activator)
VVNELSDPSLAEIDLTPNAVAFRNQLLASGFTNVFQHCHVYLLQRGRLRPGELGGIGTFWLEGAPDLTSVFNAAAKKAEDRLFPGISIPLSVNTDYVGVFTSSSELALNSASFAHSTQLQTTDPDMMQNLLLAARAGVGAVGAMQENFMQQLTAFGSQLQRMDPSVTNTQNLSIQASPDGVLSVAFISQTSASFAANPEIMRLEQERLNLEQIRLKRERLDTEHKKQKAIRLAQEERLRKLAASIDAEQKCLSEFTTKTFAGQKLLADLKSKVPVEGKRLNDLTLKVETEQKSLNDFTAKVTAEQKRLSGLVGETAAKQKQLSELTPKIPIEQKRLADFTAKIAAEQKNLTDFTAKVAAEQKRLSGLVGETAAKQKQLSELTPKIPIEQKRLADLTAKIAAEQKRLNDLAHSAAEEQRHLDGLYAGAAGQQERLNNLNRDNDNLRRQIG